MATLGKIRCDLCGFIGDLETYNGNANMRTPSGWACIYPTIRIGGERKLKAQERNAIKEKVAKKVPSMHVCPGCMVDENHWKSAGPLKLMAPPAEAM